MEDNLKTSKRKRRLYVLLLVFQLMIVFWPLFSTEMINQGLISMSFSNMGIIHMLLVLVLIIVNSLFVREFIPRIWFYLFVLNNLVNIVASFIFNGSADLRNDFELFRFYSILSSISVLIVLVVTFFIAMKDMFLIKHDITYSLIGAANIYILIGSIFSFIILMLGCIYPGLIVPPEQMVQAGNISFELAYYTLASVDLPYDPVNPIIRHILVLESIFAHLFVVIIIGRLLSK